MNKKLFGTDGIRGIANIEPLTVETLVKLGRAIAMIFKEEKKRQKIIIGKDTRLSSYLLESALTAGICSMGVDTLLVGPLPTPGIAFITRSLRADAGIVISASHNPYEDNGIKIFSSDGFKLPDIIEERIENLVFSEDVDKIRPTADSVGKIYRIDDAVGRYVEFIKNSFPKGLNLVGLKLVVDCANGSGYKVAPRVLEELGAKVYTINNEPNGKNINKNCGSLYPQEMQKMVLEVSADAGLAIDGDADRVIFSDEKGEIVDGDSIMVICGKDYKRREALAKDTLVTTIMSNMGLEKAMEKIKVRVIRTQVGDRYVLEEMLRGGYNVGGEQSGHIIFLKHNTTGDALITTLQVLKVMVRSGKSLSELNSTFTRFPQVLINRKVVKKIPLDNLPKSSKRITDIQNILENNGRIVVRYSGTENVIRIMIEGEDEEKIRKMGEELANLIEEEIKANIAY